MEVEAGSLVGHGSDLVAAVEHQPERAALGPAGVPGLLAGQVGEDVGGGPPGGGKGAVGHWSDCRWGPWCS